MDHLTEADVPDELKTDFQRFPQTFVDANRVLVRDIIIGCLMYAVILPVYIFGKEPLGIPNIGLVIFVIIPLGCYYNLRREQEAFKAERDLISSRFAQEGLDLFVDLDEKVYLAKLGQN